MLGVGGEAGCVRPHTASQAALVLSDLFDLLGCGPDFGILFTGIDVLGVGEAGCVRPYTASQAALVLFDLFGCVMPLGAYGRQRP